MSAYVVDPEHIGYLLQAAIDRADPFTVTYGHGPAWLGDGRYDGPQPETVTRANASRIGADLLAENIRSVSFRYPDDAIDDLPGPIPTPSAIDFTYRHSPYVNTDPVNVLKAISGYEYQSCEHPEWETSAAKEFCDRLRHAMIGKLSGYDDSPYWSVTREMAQPTRDDQRERIAKRNAA